MRVRTITLECDDLDFDTIQAEIARRQLCRDEQGNLLPEGDSNVAGAILAECCRDLLEYRSMFNAGRSDSHETP